MKLAKHYAMWVTLTKHSLDLAKSHRYGTPSVDQTHYSVVIVLLTIT